MRTRLLKQVHQLRDLLIGGGLPMVVAPDVLGQVERQALPPDAALGGQAALQVAPEALEAVDVALAATIRAGTVAHEPVDVALGGDAGVAGEGVGPDGGPHAHPSTDQRLQGQAAHVRHDLGPHLPAAAENPEDRRLERSAPSLGTRATGRPMPAIAPRAAHVGLVDLHGAPEHRRDLPHHRGPQHGEGPQDPLAMQLGLVGNRLRAEALRVASQQRAPLMPRQAQGQSWPPLVATASTATLRSSDNPRSGVLTSRALVSSGHTTMILNQVAGTRLYPWLMPGMSRFGEEERRGS